MRRVAFSLLMLVACAEEKNAPLVEAPEIVIIDDPGNVVGGALLKMEAFQVNFRTPGKLLTVRIQLEFHDLELSENAEALIPEIQKMVRRIYADKHYHEVVDLDLREHFRKRLIGEINRRLNLQNPVTAVYFTQFYVK